MQAPGIEAQDDYPLLTDTEQKVAAIWSELFQREVCSLEENFADLGGDSMMMMITLFRVQEEFGIELARGNLMSSPTLRQFASLLDAALEAGPDAPLPGAPHPKLEHGIL